MIDAQLEFSNQVRTLSLRHFMPTKTLPDGKSNPEDHPAMRAEAIHAASCMVSLARIFKAIETYDPSYILPVIVDLSFGLAENPFWKQHSGVLVPIYKSCLHASVTARLLRVMPNKTEQQTGIQLRQEKQWYSIFVTAYDCLYGASKSFDISTLLIQELEHLN